MYVGLRIREDGKASGGLVTGNEEIMKNDNVTEIGAPESNSGVSKENLQNGEVGKTQIEIDLPDKLERYRFLGACTEVGRLLESLFASIGEGKGNIDRSILDSSLAPEMYYEVRKNFDGVFQHGFRLASDIPDKSLSLGAFFPKIKARLDEGGRVSVGYLEREISTKSGESGDVKRSLPSNSISLLLQFEKPADAVIEIDKKPQVTTFELVLHTGAGLGIIPNPSGVIPGVIPALNERASSAYVMEIWVLSEPKVANLVLIPVKVQRYLEFGVDRESIVITDNRLMDRNVSETAVPNEPVAPL